MRIWVVVAVLLSLVVAQPVNAGLREFRDTEELAQWLSNQPDIIFIGPMDFREPLASSDCDKRAEFIQKRALQDGYLVSVQLVDGGTHMGNLTFIGKQMVYFEKLPWSRFIGTRD